MEFTVEKVAKFYVETLAECVIDHLYGELEYGFYAEDWECLTLNQQEELVKAILEKAVEIVKEGE